VVLIPSAVSDSMNTVSSSMSSFRYRHDNSALTEQRVAQILNEAKVAMKAVVAPRTKVYYSNSMSNFDCFLVVVVAVVVVVVIVIAISPIDVRL